MDCCKSEITITGSGSAPGARDGAHILLEQRMTYYWLSFTSKDKAQGEQFLGATIVEAETPVGAVRKAWNLGINPGGEVSIYPIPFDQYPELLRPEWIERLIPKDNLTAAEHSSKFDRGTMA